jgi:pSer/pThr/pTyr-binding forkhead associated (FHA) protein
MLGRSMLRLQLKHQPDHYVSLRAGLVTLGRDETNGLVLNSEDVSDFHAEVIVEDDSVVIADLLSREGTFVNDRRVAGRCTLEPWDVIRLGSVELELNDPRVTKPSVWALEVTHPTGRVDRFELASITSIGRDPGCDISLDSELLSRRHAEIRIARGYLEVTDLGSVNGTLLNGRPIDRAPAYARDQLTIDPYSFLVVGPSINSVNRDSWVSDRTMIKHSDDVESQLLEMDKDHGDIDETELLTIDIMAAYLVEESSLLPDPVITLTRNSIAFGRLPHIDVTLADRSVSKLHARLEFHSGEWFIEDCQSSNGVKVNGVDTLRTALQDGDVFKLGRATFRFHTGRSQG